MSSKPRKKGSHKSVMAKARKNIGLLTKSFRKQRSDEKKRKEAFINNAQKKKLIAIVERIADGEKVKIGELRWLGPGVGYASGGRTRKHRSSTRRSSTRRSSARRSSTRRSSARRSSTRRSSTRRSSTRRSSARRSSARRSST